MVRNERGIALVITLLVVALLTITVVEFTYSVEIDQHMARNSVNALQATLLARSGINLGEAFLLHDDDPQMDAYTEDWGQIDQLNSQLIVPDGMRLRVRIVDESGKFNINSLRPMNTQEWHNYENSQQSGAPSRLASLRDAFGELVQSRGGDPMSADLVIQYFGQLLDLYFPVPQPGQRNQPGQLGATPVPTPMGGLNATPGPQAQIQMQALDFPSLDDASVIPGFTPDLIRRLRSVVTALPAGLTQRINANTAPLEVLAAVIGDPAVAENIVSQREQTGMHQAELTPLLASAAAGTGQNGAPSRTSMNAMLGTTSQYYLIRASAMVNVNPLTGRGGISRSASMLVRRSLRGGVPANAQATALPAAQRWTLTQLDWQKESGAALFVEKSESGMGADDTGLLQNPGLGG